MNESQIKKLSEDYGVSENNFNSIFNLDQKMNFIEEEYCSFEKSYQSNIIRLFNSLSSIEKKYNTDINTFDLPKLVEYFKQAKVTKDAAFINHKNILKKYFEWSVSKKLIAVESIQVFNELTENLIK